MAQHLASRKHGKLTKRLSRETVIDEEEREFKRRFLDYQQKSDECFQRTLNGLMSGITAQNELINTNLQQMFSLMNNSPTTNYYGIGQQYPQYPRDQHGYSAYNPPESEVSPTYTTM